MEKNIFRPDRFERKLAIVMPVYNEEESLPTVIESWEAAARETGAVLLFINDGSKDRSLEILKSYQRKYGRIVILDKANSGHGSSCLEGYRWAVDENFQWIFQTDSDGQTEVDDFLKIWHGQAKDEYDFIFGRREKRGDGLYRLLVTKVLKMAIRLIFGIIVEDANTPFRLMKVDKLKMVLEQVPRDLFLANAYLTISIQKKFPIFWERITFAPRRAGKASVSYLRFIKIGKKVIQEFWRCRFI